VVSELERRIHASNGRKYFFSAIRASRPHFHFLSRFEILCQTFNVENFKPRESQSFRVLIRQKFEWQDSHTHQIAAMNALKTFSQHDSDAQQSGPFGSPVTRRTGAVFLAG